ncbi:MAG: N-acetyl-gamma-glutamyl-phosphate reductase [Anaerofustis stercorihominis]|nr:N-acetyl-gamma-glutamyl-phosphate reductase [Anaerofustis stercorihominis]
MVKVFIDGRNGTTGLRIDERLAGRDDITLIVLPEELRKDENARKDAINSADIAFLCLPDNEAVNAVAMTENENTVIIDTSTAHRISEGWAYGFPEMKGQKEVIKNAKRIANPGCHAIGFVSLIQPLVAEGIIPKSSNLSCMSLTGYSGGGKNMIAEYENACRNTLLDAPRQYGITQSHKHLKEMKGITGLGKFPAFMPVVADFYSGMEVTVPLFGEEINGNIKDIKEVYKEYYKSAIVHYDEDFDENGYVSAGKYSGKDDMQIAVSGNDERILLISRFDNLGKGASGSAIQNMNIVLGCDEAMGLNI